MNTQTENPPFQYPTFRSSPYRCNSCETIWRISYFNIQQSFIQSLFTLTTCFKYLLSHTVTTHPPSQHLHYSLLYPSSNSALPSSFRPPSFSSSRLAPGEVVSLFILLKFPFGTLFGSQLQLCLHRVGYQSCTLFW